VVVAASATRRTPEHDHPDQQSETEETTMGRLDDKVVAITGGASGMGAATALRMTEEGAAVAVVDRNADLGRSVVADLVATGATARFYQCDVTDEDQVAATIAAIIADFGRIDVWVNNAGLAGVVRLTHELPLSEYNEVMAVNVTAAFLCTKHLVGHFRSNGGGNIINVSSIFGIVGAYNRPHYHASKGAIRIQSKADALMYAADNIRVNTIHPGYVYTPMLQGYLDEIGKPFEEIKPEVDALHPLGGMGEPDDIAWAAVFLASDQAKWITGSELVVDGGYTAG
jgi:NAD(P)-dependent dehydrogenase (short-subunit alcohol dehydrogenase family)